MFFVLCPGKSLFCPIPDYPTRLKLWSTLIAAKGVDIASLTFDPNFNLGILATITHGYTTGSVWKLNAIFHRAGIMVESDCGRRQRDSHCPSNSASEFSFFNSVSLFDFFHRYTKAKGRLSHQSFSEYFQNVQSSTTTNTKCFWFDSF